MLFSVRGLEVKIGAGEAVGLPLPFVSMLSVHSQAEMLPLLQEEQPDSEPSITHSQFINASPVSTFAPNSTGTLILIRWETAYVQTAPFWPVQVPGDTIHGFPQHSTETVPTDAKGRIVTGRQTSAYCVADEANFWVYCV
jgi:hypothetical protein